jgi:putative transposase
LTLWHAVFSIARIMPRPLRVEYEGARYHVLSRGDRREDIVLDDGDRERFVKTLGEAAVYAGWQVHAFCLMSNHFHLVIETPEPTLVKGMQWMLGTFTARFNARHRLRGHLFSGRYKAIVVDHVDDWYLRRACDYSHLNPVRAGILGPQQRLEQYAWSSYPMYLQSPRKRPAWLRVDRLLGEHGVARDSAAGRREFSRRVEVRRLEEDAELRQTLKRGWRLGAEDFLDRLEDSLGLSLSEDHAAVARRETLEVRAQRLIDEELRKQKRSREDLASLPKGASLKVKIAERLHRETPMTMRWIADALHMGTWRYLSFLLYQRRFASQ